MNLASQELQLRRAGVPLGHIFRDVGVSGTTDTQERRGWHRVNSRMAGGDALAVVAIDRVGRTWQDTVRSICELRERGVKNSFPWPRRRPVDQAPGSRRGAPRPSLGRSW